MTDTRDTDHLLRLIKGNKPTPPPPTTFDPDLIPPDEQPYRTDEDINLDRKLKDFPIEEAYRRWVGKGAPKMSGRADSNMVRCPRPDHVDHEPSAWFNTKLNTGCCGVCRSTSSGGNWGFDPYDLFAIGAGFNVDSYKTDGTFPTLRRAMAEELGYHVGRSLAGKEIVRVADPGDNPGDEAVEPQEAPETRHLRVVPIEPPEDDSEPQEEFSGGTIDWRAIVTEDSTFLRSWMNVCTDDDLPEEFYFWLGLSALGLASGNDYLLADRHPVRGNLMICLVGKPGLGKSRSIYALEDLMRKALPFRPGTTGVRLIPDPGSGEALVDLFALKDEDGNPLPVRGLLVVNELASLTGKANRQGNTMKTTMQALYDQAGPYGISSRGSKEVTASEHFCSIVSTTQPELMGTLLSADDANSGFVSRWVFVTGTTKPLVAYGGQPLDIEPLRKPISDIRSFAAKRRQIRLDEEAEPAWETFFRTELEPMKLGDKSVFARVDLLMKKLMLLFSLDRQKAYVSLTAVQQAVALWPYLKTIYGLVNIKTTVSAAIVERANVEERVKRQIEKLEATPDRSRTVNAIRQGLGEFGKTIGRDGILQAIKTLETSGEVEPFVREKTGPGRPRGVEYRVAR